MQSATPPEKDRVSFSPGAFSGNAPAASRVVSCSSKPSLGRRPAAISSASASRTVKCRASSWDSASPTCLWKMPCSTGET